MSMQRPPEQYNWDPASSDPVMDPVLVSDPAPAPEAAHGTLQGAAGPGPGAVPVEALPIGPEGATAARRGMPGWAVGAIVVGVIVVLACAALAVATVGVVGWLATRPTPDSGTDPIVYDDLSGYAPGVVTDETGQAVEDGTGGYESPATVGEHSFVWETWDGGDVTVRATALEIGSALPGSEGADVLQDGYELVVLTADVDYSGPGSFEPAYELWVAGETPLSYYSDVAPGLVPDPLMESDALSDGDSVTLRAAVLVPEDEVDELVLAVSAASGDTLYYGTAG